MKTVQQAVYLAILFSICVSAITLTGKVYSNETADESHDGLLSKQVPIMVLEIAWSPSGDYLAVGRNNGLWLYDKDGDEVTHRDGSQVSAIAWSPNSEFLAASDNTRGQVLILSIPDFEILEDQVSAAGGENEIPLNWNPNPELAVLASAAGKDILFWNTSSWDNFDAFQKAHADTISVLEWSPDGSKLASGGFDYMIHIWDYPSGDQINSLKVGDYVKDINWLEDSTTVVFPDVRGKFLFWNYLTNEITTVETGSFVVFDVELNNEIIAASTNDGVVWVQNRELEMTPYLLDTQLRALSIDIAPDGRSITYPGVNGAVLTTQVILMPTRSAPEG
ncbi:MAG: hypothetical protein BroJett018_47880 [Chloroflexota bacterium]|nr:WD40 repeat domain-containing protein [Chloroflexota bacterium]NOG65830.1 WD40 repeat domain-containing protein [Chloroflexota bacterium]GIK66994.1 MAG: hypothetical protein BroJett018_47880 [Chloroflexota bacterium]